MAAYGEIPMAAVIENGRASGKVVITLDDNCERARMSIVSRGPRRVVRGASASGARGRSRAANSGVS